MIHYITPDQISQDCFKSQNSKRSLLIPHKKKVEAFLKSLLIVHQRKRLTDPDEDSYNRTQQTLWLWCLHFNTTNMRCRLLIKVMISVFDAFLYVHDEFKTKVLMLIGEFQEK